MRETPPLVLRALALAGRLGLERSCLPEEGALRHVLAARRGAARVAEIGGGAGVGAAWIVSALPPRVPFFTVEPESGLARRTAELFADDPNVTVLAGPWRELLPREAPFDLLFAAARDARDDVDAVVGLLAPGGMVVLDDFGGDTEPPDPRLHAWLDHPLLSAVALPVASDRRALLAVRR